MNVKAIKFGLQSAIPSCGHAGRSLRIDKSGSDCVLKIHHDPSYKCENHLIKVILNSHPLGIVYAYAVFNNHEFEGFRLIDSGKELNDDPKGMSPIHVYDYVIVDDFFFRDLD